MEAEAAGPAGVAQRCNLCWQAADGPCYRTTCAHLFCEACAYAHFGQEQTCPACGIQLSESDIAELMIGVEPAQFAKSLFQEIYKDPSYQQVTEAVARTTALFHDSVTFVLGQLSLEGQRAASAEAGLQAELVKQKHENGRLSMQLRAQASSLEQKLKEADHRLRLKDKDFMDLQEAYKEKNRKCTAWEKAYHNLRAQISAGRGGNAGGGRQDLAPPPSPSLSSRSSGQQFSRQGMQQQQQQQQQQQHSTRPMQGGVMGQGLSPPQPQYRQHNAVDGESPLHSFRAAAPFRRSSAPPSRAHGMERPSPMMRPAKHNPSMVSPPMVPQQQAQSGPFAGGPKTVRSTRGYYSKPSSYGGDAGAGGGAGVGAGPLGGHMFGPPAF